MKVNIDFNKHANLSFLGCEKCDAKCCGSKIIYLTAADFLRVSQYFPIFFHIKNNKISLVYFFYHTTGNKCMYLKNNLCSIYEKRPYACRTYPFSHANDSEKISFDTDCPEFSEEPNGLQLIKKNNLNPEVINNYIDPDMIKYSQHIFGETDEYINFCLENKLLEKFTKVCEEDSHNNFQSEYREDLYIIYQAKASITMLKKKELFNNNRFKDFIKAQINSLAY